MIVRYMDYFSLHFQLSKMHTTYKMLTHSLSIPTNTFAFAIPPLKCSSNVGQRDGERGREMEREDPSFAS